MTEMETCRLKFEEEILGSSSFSMDKMIFN